jgi:hypothetical protein
MKQKSKTISHSFLFELLDTGTDSDHSNNHFEALGPVFRFRIRKFLGIPDLEPDPRYGSSSAYGSGSGPFDHQAKLVHKIFILLL